MNNQSTPLPLTPPEPWPTPVDPPVLLDNLAALLKRFVILPAWAPESLALWTLHTYAFHLRDVTTYLGVESPEKRCGKTTLLTVLSELVNRPIIAANISPPALFRVIEESHPTLLIDEADSFLHGNNEIRGILNSGYTRKSAYVVRVARLLPPQLPLADAPQPEDASAPEPQPPPSTSPTSSPSRLARFSCWCPKVMAAIGRLPDTLADRCITIRMQRKTSQEQCDRARNLDATALRRQCVRFVMDNSAQIATARPSIPSVLDDRAGEIWEPLLALADLAGARWPDLARQAAEALSLSARDGHPTSALLLDILSYVLDFPGKRLFSRHLVAGLNRVPSPRWSELTNGKQITEHALARHLRPYGIQPKTMRIDQEMAKGYLLQDFSEALRRYVPNSEIQALLTPPPPDPEPPKSDAQLSP